MAPALGLLGATVRMKRVDTVERVAGKSKSSIPAGQRNALGSCLWGCLATRARRIPSEVRRHTDPRIRGFGLGFTDAILAFLLFFHGFINTQPISLDIFDSQGEQLTRAQSAGKENAENRDSPVLSTPIKKACTSTNE